MKLPIYLYGHPVLRQTAEPVKESSEELTKLIDDMYATMYASEGVGLAAPQIGKSIRLVVIDASPVADSFPECAGRKMTLINPEIEILEGTHQPIRRMPVTTRTIGKRRTHRTHTAALARRRNECPRGDHRRFSGAHRAARMRPSRRQALHRPHIAYTQAADTPQAKGHSRRSHRMRLSSEICIQPPAINPAQL